MTQNNITIPTEQDIRDATSGRLTLAEAEQWLTDRLKVTQDYDTQDLEEMGRMAWIEHRLQQALRMCRIDRAEMESAS